MAHLTDQPEEIWHLLSDKLNDWLRSFIQLLPNLAVASLVMVLAILLAVLTSKYAPRFLHRLAHSEAVIRLVIATLRIFFFCFGLFAALGILNLQKTVASLLAGAGVIGLAIGFAFQEIAANFFAGVLIAIRKPYSEGDIVQIESFIGTVNQISLRTTNLTTAAGLEVLIPNKDMFTKPVTNFTSTPFRQIQLSGGISYDDDLRKAEQVAIETAKKIEGRIADLPVEFFFTGYGDSSINFQLRFWIRYPENNLFLRATHQIIVELKEAFDLNGIHFPYPIRTLEFTQELPKSPA